MVAYDTKIKGRTFVEVHTHGEADTQPSTGLNSTTSLLRDVYFIPCHRRLHSSYQYCVSRSTCTPSTPAFFNVQRRKYREIDIIKRVQVIGFENAKGSLDYTTSLVLIRMGNLSGSLRILGPMLTWPLMKMNQL